MLAQIRAAAIAATSTPALPDSVCRNARSGADRFRAQIVLPRHAEAAGAGLTHRRPWERDYFLRPGPRADAAGHRAGQ